MTSPRHASLLPLALALPLALLLAACSGQVAELPGGALVTCGSTADCPSGYICRATLGRCVLPGGDETAPVVQTNTLVVTPVRVGRSTPAVTVAFDVSEPLAADPEASLSWSGPGATTRQLTVTSRPPATSGYLLTYTPAPATDPEGDVSLVVTLIDAAGNQGHVELPHVAVFDLTPPVLAVDGNGASIASVTLTPPATSPLRDVTAVTAGTRLRVDFAVSEPLPLAGDAAAPVVTLTSGSASLQLTPVSGNGLSYVSEVVVPAGFPGVVVPPGFPERPASLAAHLTDLAGNVNDVLLATVVPVSTQRPATPAVATPGAVRFHRLPWGSEATGGAQAYFLRGAAGSVPAGSIAVVYSDPTVVSATGTLVGREIARIAAEPNGAFGGDLGDPAPFQLFMGDAPDVYVASVDAAGNVSDADGDPSNGVQAALVRDVAWTATMLGKLPGRVFPNPHGFEGRQVWTPTLGQSGARPLASPAEVGRQDATQASVRGAPWWLPASVYGPLGYRGGVAMDHDPVRGCRVAYGGESWDGCDSGFYCSQWESCRGAPWTKPTVEDPEGDGNPALNTRLPLVFAGGRGATVLSDGTGLWEWDGTSWRKLVMTDPEGDGDPSPRRDHSIAYDEARQRLVLFGGVATSGGATLGDTWETDFRSWRRVCTGAPCTASMPAARSRHRLVHDPVHGQTLLLGGNTLAGYDAATWTWNGTAWTNACGAGACATAAQRAGHGLAFDAGRGRVVAFGGATAGGVSNELFEWDGATWTAACTAAPCNATVPTGRSDAGFFYDAERRRMVLFGGTSSGFGNPECSSYWCPTEWEWDGTAWSQVLAITAGPPSVRGVTPVYDAFRDQVVLFGGLTNGSTYSSATWLWDGSRWSAAAPATVPAGRSQYAAAYVATGIISPDGYVAMSGGYNGAVVGSTYTWNGSTWSLAGAGPAARYQGAMAQSLKARALGSGGGGALLFGGDDGGGTQLCDTWELSASAWTGSAVCLAGSPSARRGLAMVRATGFTGAPVVLVGGSASFVDQNDVWSFNGTWTQASPGGPASATMPAPRTGHGLFYDTGRNRVLLWGGGPAAVVSNVNCVDDYGGVACHDFWEWSGADWTRVFPVDLYGDGSPDPYRLEGIAFDTRRRLGVGLVSDPAAGASIDTWWWHGGPDDRPGQLLSVVFDAAEVRRPFDVLDLQVTWVGGASGAPGGTVTPGASLQVWDNRAWRTLVASATASPAAPETLSWSLATDPVLGASPVAERQRFMVGDQRILHLGLVPAAASGRAAGFGEVGTDYVEVTVAYRLAAP